MIYKMYRVDKEMEDKAIIPRLVKEISKTGKPQSKQGILRIILKEEVKRLIK